MEDTLKRHLHKVARCLHDGICPKCGGGVRRLVEDADRGFQCKTCGLHMTQKEDYEIRAIIGDDAVLGKSVIAFEAWKREKSI